MSEITFEKTALPIDTQGRYGCTVHDVANERFLYGILDGTQFTCVNGFEVIKMDLSGATEVPGLEAEAEEIYQHNRKMEAWRDQD